MTIRSAISVALFSIITFGYITCAHADTLTLTAGANATTTPNVATAITGFQIVGPASQTTPVKLRATHGTLNLSTVSGVTMSGNGTSTVNLSGTVANLNTALSTLTYTRGSTGSDTLEVSLVDATQIFFTDNGHLYQYISGTINWNNAKTAAEGRTAYGATGYLATITSAAENNFIKARLSGDAWIGGSDSQTEGTWKWVTGPESGTTFWQGTGGGSTVGGNYANWSGGEPNQSGEEDCAETYIANGTWNDLPCTTTVSGYVAEFGAPGNMPTVVAANISITTADVPAITSLSPANGVSLVNSGTNLVVGFSKAVTKQTGSILIRRSSDDTIVETIDAAGSQVSGSGTSTITIDPSVDLPEGTSLYVTIPNTAFKDSSNNFFEGITVKTTWVFTTNDVTAPILSDITATPTDTSVSITWQTNELASTRLLYSLDTSYGSATSEVDTSPRVASHQVSLSGLIPCTLYYYKVVSKDAFTNTATSSGSSFLTTGCSASTTPLSTSSETVDVSNPTPTVLTENGNTLSVEPPANFTTEASSVVIQIKGISADPVIASIGTPATSLLKAASVVFDVKALIDGTTLLDSFDTPVTITYHYTPADIEGLTESSLWLYHYHANAWQPLNACTIDTVGDVVTCTAPHFSIFGLFGTLIPPATNAGGGGTTLQGRINNLAAMGKTDAARSLALSYGKEIPSTGISTPSPVASVVRTLRLGLIGADVRALQQALNATATPIALQGPGSKGKETEKFGPLTKTAVQQFQRAHNLQSDGIVGPLTRALLFK